ncbi:tyrosine-type recombinase/integrase [Gammaproteobacteria bacterium]|nr:tyrosine-type recombinase/integrase [Gammaproteobacteria bacterium]
MKIYIPRPLIPSSDQLARSDLTHEHLDFSVVKLFLLSYIHSNDTYNAYRRDIERFCHWLWYIKEQDLKSFCYEDALHYVSFFQNPPQQWIASAHVARFKDDSQVEINPDWRPFVLRKDQIAVSPQSIKAMLACLSSFCTFLIHEEVLLSNPIARIKQKKQLVATMPRRVKRRLSQLQWKTMIQLVQQKADTCKKYERHLFLLSTFYLLGLRISELSSDDRFKSMSTFYADRKGRWWYEAHGKGNKIREVAVPDAMLDALRRYRRSLGLSDLPSASDLNPLLPKIKGVGGLGQRQVRYVISEAFSIAEEQLRIDGHADEAGHLAAATVHWLRHTAISDDVLNRPGEHVRDDVGHENLSTTSLYIDVLDEKRHESAQLKTLLPKD